MTAWFPDYIIEPLNTLLSAIAEGDEVRDLGDCRMLGMGVEALFRSRAHEYAGWPHGSTTDGSSVAMCLRTGADTLELAGMTFIDFDGRRFPFRVEMTRISDGSAHVTAYIGQVDRRTGEPPRFPSGTILIPQRDESDMNPVAELIVGHRQVPVAWTKAFEAP